MVEKLHDKKQMNSGPRERKERKEARDRRKRRTTTTAGK